jgi:hypothetical protein
VVFGALGDWRAKELVEWEEKKLVLLLNQKRGARGHARAAAAAARWRTAEPRGGVARAREGQGGGARAVLGLGATCGGERSRRWRRGGAGAAVSSVDGRQHRNRAGEQSTC